MNFKTFLYLKQYTIVCLFFFFGKTVAQTTVVDSIISNGIYRSYRLYVPAIYSGTSARPLIINMHGYGSDNSQQQYYSNFMPIADTANFLMVYPNGTFEAGKRYWNAGISPIGAHDIEFIYNLIDNLKTKYNIDHNAIYATGMSNGGFMSHTLACELSDRIAAIASVTGSIFTTQYGSNCHPARPVPVMQIHGTADPTVPYNGSAPDNMMPIDSVVKYWVTKNGCSSTPTFSNVPNTNLSDGCTAEHYRYLSGYLGSSVELYKIIGGMHTWPGFSVGGFSTPGTNLDMDASKEIWRFFRQYKLDKLTSINELHNTNFLVNFYPNPVHSVLNINTNEVNGKITSVQLIDVLGNVVLTKTDYFETINIESLKAGIYFLIIQNNSSLVYKAKLIKE